MEIQLYNQLNNIDFNSLPLSARKELYQFYIKLREKYLNEDFKTDDISLLSQEALKEEWFNDEEEEAWATFQ